MSNFRECHIIHSPEMVLITLNSLDHSPTGGIHMKHGVTLTELLITIIIISILSTVIYMSFFQSTIASQRAKLQLDANAINIALAQAYRNKPARPWPGSANPSDRTHWVIYLQPGDSATIFSQKELFGFRAPNNGARWPNEWGKGADGFYRFHQGEPGGVPLGVTPPAGCPLPEKIKLWEDIQGESLPDMIPLQGLPYHAFP